MFFSTPSNPVESTTNAFTFDDNRSQQLAQSLIQFDEGNSVAVLSSVIPYLLANVTV